MARAIVAALMCAGPGAASVGWRAEDGCAERVARIGLEQVRVRLHCWNAELAWREVTGITPLALSTLVVLVDRLQRTDRKGVVLSPGEVLAARGCRRWGGERQALERQIGHELLRLGVMTLNDSRQPLFSVAPIGDEGDRFFVALDPAVRALWAASPQRRLDWRLLNFDHRHNRGVEILALKMGLYFGLAGAGLRPVTRSVRAVLKGVGALDDGGCGGRGGRLADHFEEAALRLQERDLLALTYRGAGESSVLDERTKGWVSRWLDSVVIVRAAQSGRDSADDALSGACGFGRHGE
jgi:hypothetical protein